MEGNIATQDTGGFDKLVDLSFSRFFTLFPFRLSIFGSE